MLKGDMSRSSVDFFCLTVPKILVVEAFCALFQKNSVREKVYGKGGDGEYQYFQSKIFCLTEPKILVGVSFSVSLISGIEKS